MAGVGLLSLVTASVAFTLSESAVFTSLRDRVKSRSVWLGKLACCGYCLGHWVSLGLIAIYRPKPFDALWLLDYSWTALVAAWLAAFQWAALCWLMEKAGK